MAGRKLIIRALAAIASATAFLGLAAAAHAAPVGPCADVPFIGVCVPPSEQPTPPPQQSLGETAFLPGTGIHVVN